MRRPYRKHFVILENKTTKVKDWMRQNSNYFKGNNGIPTSEQIGIVLVDLGYVRTEKYDCVIYN